MNIKGMMVPCCFIWRKLLNKGQDIIKEEDERYETFKN